MRIFLFTLITCFTISFGYTQEFKTEHSNYFNKDNEKSVYKIVLPSAYGFMTLHYLDHVMMDNIKAMVLTKYDQSMQAVETKTFNLPKLGLRASDLRELVELDDQLIFLSTVMSKKKAQHQVNAQVYVEKENTVTNPKVLASFTIDGYSKSGFYQFAVSPDQTKIAIVANLPFAKKTQEKVKIWVYDNQLNLLWEQSETLSYKSKRAYQENIFVQNSGIVVLHKIIDPYKKTRRSQLLTFNGNSFETKDFSSEGFIPMQMKLIEVNSISMLVGFFWNGKNSIIKINSKEGEDNDGAFLYDLSTNSILGIHQWSNTINSDNLKSLSILDVKVIDNTIYMIGEKQLENSEFRKNGNVITNEIDYFYTFGSSIIVSLDTKGTLKSFTPLFNSKQYKNQGKEKGSLAVLYLENGLYVFSNNENLITLNTFFTKNIISFEKPRVIPFEHGSTSIPFILPKTVTAVKKYNIVYYITNYRDRYWLNKMTW